MSNMLLIADLHLTDNPKDEYRWKFLDWLVGQLEIHEITTLVMAGDLTESKDHHSSFLVNRLVHNVKIIANYCDQVIIIKGNHDYVDSNVPFFGFLGELNKVVFVNSEYSRKGNLFLAHTKNPEADWKNIEFDDYKNIFIHQDSVGAILSNNTELGTGLPKKYFDKVKTQIFSGHIHVPQTINNIIYVGAPYPVDCGDDYMGRCIILKSSGKYTDITYPCINKPSIIIQSLDELENGFDIRKGDQIKIRIKLDMNNMHESTTVKKQVKKYCESKGIIIQSLSVCIIPESKKIELDTDYTKMDDTSIFNEYIKSEKLSEDHKNIGLTIINE